MAAGEAAHGGGGEGGGEDSKLGGTLGVLGAAASHDTTAFAKGWEPDGSRRAAVTVTTENGGRAGLHTGTMKRVAGACCYAGRREARWSSCVHAHEGSSRADWSRAGQRM